MKLSELRELLSKSSLITLGGIVVNKWLPLPPGVDVEEQELYSELFACDKATFTPGNLNPDEFNIKDIQARFKEQNVLVPNRPLVLVVRGYWYNGGLPVSVRVDLIRDMVSPRFFYNGIEDAAAVSYVVFPDEAGNRYIYFYALNVTGDETLNGLVNHPILIEKD